jgi:hypothetical protein
VTKPSCEFWRQKRYPLLILPQAPAAHPFHNYGLFFPGRYSVLPENVAEADDHILYVYSATDARLINRFSLSSRNPPDFSSVPMTSTSSVPIKR